MRKRTSKAAFCILLIAILVSLSANSQSFAFEVDAATKQRLEEMYGLDEPAEAESPFYADFGSSMPNFSGHIDDSGIYFDDLSAAAKALAGFSIPLFAPLPACTQDVVAFLADF